MHERSSIEPPPSARALVVDPGRDARARLAAWITAAGYATRTAASFEEARHLLEHGGTDVLVTNLRLGPFNGLHLVITARLIAPAIRAIVLTMPAELATVAAEADPLGAVCLASPTREALLAAMS